MKNLHHELRSAGASEAEARHLSALAGELKQLKGANERAEIKAPPRHIWKQVAVFGVTATAGLLVGAILVMYAQAALPGSWLYPVQQASDNVAIRFQPSYRADVMMKRARQVKQLAANHAGTQKVRMALVDYQTVANAYASTSDDYAAFEYCETNLRQAATMATPAERAAINNTLDRLPNV